MMSIKSPQLRFEGFTDDWEQRKLGELSQKISVGIATSSSKYFSSQDQGVPFIKNQDIKENRINTKNLEYISKEFDNKNKNKRVKQGDIITARTGYPGLSAVVPKELEGAQTFTTLITRPISEMILSEYISIFINSPYGMKQISGMEAGGAQKNVNAGIVQNLLIPLPSLDEQKKISNFILKLDDTIALNQRKIDLLKEQKKGYLQKMFPKNGAKVPELRFAGFVDDWEQRKLSDLMTFSNGINAPKENYGKGTKMISVMDILNPLPIKYDNILNSVSVDKKIEDKNKVENGDLIFVRSSEIVEEVGWAKAYKEARYALYSGFAIRGKRISSYNAYFIELTLNYANRKEIKRRAGGSTRFNVSQEILNSLTVLTPSISEQNQIDLFFTKIDDTITLHQRKLDLLKEQKKGFLQKMFV
ncbi:restriction endonuclease subunit S [Lactococcus cremoris]|uniref:Probable specificity determinant HsdS n=6 Tax=Lactococcus lactis subsp. cremoris TaxID=1359 RepID=A2RJ13_LACLM|nr:restriction endonuclease subunit S [Lactococcus cremoris]MCZ7689957.1 restriction endonuclease subunit S [Lactococcus cremoris]MCZ7692307.1 restriction endonuclease subunit S [Lactococcus cremoris]CAL97261.1 probable specificity determinant HsdS [Lactococcus cremoris subsp. cremoris MG1363]